MRCGEVRWDLQLGSCMVTARQKYTCERVNVKPSMDRERERERSRTNKRGGYDSASLQTALQA